MSVLDRSELEQSHLADLHAIASELGIEGYRRLSRDALIDAILAGDAGDGGDDVPSDEPSEEEKPRGRGRRLRLRRGRDEEEEESNDHDDGAELVLPEGDDAESAADEPKAEEPEEKKEQEDVRTGVLDILPGGSGFMREDAFVHSREDVYVSPAQIRRCELRAGDELSGPVRPPRRNERHPSLVRVETVNGSDAEPPEERPWFGDLTPVPSTAPLGELKGVAYAKGARVAVV